MATPNKKEIAKAESKLASLEEKYGNNTLTDKEMCTIIRTSVRKSWMRSPVKLLKLERARLVDDDPNTRTKWLWECEICENKFKGTNIEVDHIKGEHKLTELSDIEPFARSVLEVTCDDLQVVCKVCHEIKTYAERYGMSFEDAAIEKKVISWLKGKKVAVIKKKLSALGCEDNDMKNAKQRKDIIRKFIQEDKL